MHNLSCDVLVIGTGASGTAAAVAAARSGVRTVLVERDGFPGGTGYAGMFRHICGLYLNSDAFPAETLNAGIAREIAGLLTGFSIRSEIKQIGRVYVLSYNREGLQTVFSSLLSGEDNLTVYYNASAVSVDRKGNDVASVNVDLKGRPNSISPGVVIDCSGSGDVSVMAGASYEMSGPDELQLAGHTLYLKGLKDMDETLSIKVPYYLSEAVREKRLPDYLKFTTFDSGDAPDEGYCKISICGPDGNEREKRAGKDAAAVYSLLKERLPSFESSQVVERSSRVLDREGRRITGEYVLTEEDVLSAVKFHDGVVKNSWPIEIWDRNRGTVYKYLEPGEYYDIPFRCLKVKGLTNLLCSGRCISVSHEALGSTRVMGTCLSLGEQAGLAAAHYVKKGKYLFG